MLLIIIVLVFIILFFSFVKIKHSIDDVEHCSKLTTKTLKPFQRCNSSVCEVWSMFIVSFIYLFFWRCFFRVILLYFILTRNIFILWWHFNFIYYVFLVIFIYLFLFSLFTLFNIVLKIVKNNSTNKCQQNQLKYYRN